MEILSDATFKGNVSINGGDFSVTRPGESDPVILTGPCGSTGKVDINGCVNFYSDVYVEKSAGISHLNVYCSTRINGGAYIFGGATNIDGDFSVTRPGESYPFIQTNVPEPAGGGNYALYVDGSEFVRDNIIIEGRADISGGIGVGGSAYIGGDTNIHGALSVNGSEYVGGITVGHLMVDGNTDFRGGIYTNTYIQLGPESISTWGDLRDVIQIPKLSTFTSPSIPANCTAFEFTGTAISDTNKTHMIQVQNTSTGKSVIAETWITTNKKPAMSFAGCTSTIAEGTYTAMVV